MSKIDKAKQYNRTDWKPKPLTEEERKVLFPFNPPRTLKQLREHSKFKNHNATKKEGDNTTG